MPSRFYIYDSKIKDWRLCSKDLYDSWTTADAYDERISETLLRIDTKPLDEPSRIVYLVLAGNFACVKPHQGALFSLYQTSTHDKDWRKRVEVWCEERGYRLSS